jgi:iron(III) transport system substrate-binding protein
MTRTTRFRPAAWFAVLAVAAAALTSCNSGSKDELVVYSGRNQNLIGPLLERYARESGVDIRVKYADTGETLATLLEEGDRTRADVFISQDAGALGVLAGRGMFEPLPQELFDDVQEGFFDGDLRWVGLTGRVRVIAYNTERVSEDEVPDSVFDVLDPKWKGRVGYPPTNASFIAFVSALRSEFGDDRAREFLEGLKANDAQRLDNNILVLNAIANGEIDLGLVNHYYLYSEIKEQGDDVPVANHYPGLDGEGEGTFVNLSGVAMIDGTDQREEALDFIEFLLSDEAQEYFRDETTEYPTSNRVDAIDELPPLDSIRTFKADPVRIGEELESTVEMIKDVGLT